MTHILQKDKLLDGEENYFNFKHLSETYERGKDKEVEFQLDSKTSRKKMTHQFKQIALRKRLESRKHKSLECNYLCMSKKDMISQ